ncbi:MAG: TetR/AcrR family transcriptional regulator [Phycisphaerales bacterium]|nr:MAG: TetR/AcrR family transcriptional regulator [Phycisphaerales bacterium]
MPKTTSTSGQATRDRLLDAAHELMAVKGYTAASVDEICSAAGMTKGAFFHYFDSKEELARALAERVYASAKKTFTAAPCRTLSDPLERVFGYVDLLIEMSRDPAAAKGCILGTFSQELADTHPGIRSVCAACFKDWAADLEKDLRAAKAQYAPKATWTAHGLAEHLIAVLEGAIILAKAKQDRKPIEDGLLHFKTYLRSLMERSV